jgi:ArsR family transcriptional regulator, arsenate/arsenite/antimonite-responsive transcriptional repressor / arsenate reductase (thioredoxin)
VRQVSLQLLAHPLRWRLLTELARSDRRVGELRAAVGVPQNLVSYHLGRLRNAGLVSARRSSADQRDTYYRAELGRCGDVLASSGAALHPALRLAPPPARPVTRAVRVLFLCTGNSARSQVAEALLQHLAGGLAEAASAGSNPKPVHPLAVRVLRERGIDIEGRASKHLDTFAGRRFDYVVSLCDRVREVCPEFPGATLVHWSIPDPAAEDDYGAFVRTAAELELRIRFLLHLLTEPEVTT